MDRITYFTSKISLIVSSTRRLPLTTTDLCLLFPFHYAPITRHTKDIRMVHAKQN